MKRFLRSNLASVLGIVGAVFCAIFCFFMAMTSCTTVQTSGINTVQQVAFRAAARHIGYEMAMKYPEETEQLVNICSDYLNTGKIDVLSTFKKELLALVDGNPLLQKDLDDLITLMGVNIVTVELGDIPNIRSALEAFLEGACMGLAIVEGVQS